MADFRRVDALLERFAKETIPGCALVVMKGDEVIYEGYKGYADIEAKKPITADSIFRHASTTKLFTYAILGMLYEEGKFLYTDPLSDFLPEWTDTKKWVRTSNNDIEIVPISRPITIRDATAMMCGMPYCMAPIADPKYKMNPTLAAMSEQMRKLTEQNPYPSLRDQVRVMAEVPVMFDPGTHWQYGFGSEIMGAVVEEIEGKPLREVFKDRIMDPLGLKNTGSYITDFAEGQMVGNYRKTPDGQLIKLPDSADAWNKIETCPVDARVSLLSSARDFTVFMQMLANGGIYKGTRLLSEGTVEMLHTNLLSEEIRKDFKNDYLAGYGYGLGFRTLLDKGEGGHNGHLGSFGWTGGAGIWAEADPVDHVGITYMHNMAPNEELYHHIRARNAVYAALGCE